MKAGREARFFVFEQFYGVGFYHFQAVGDCSGQAKGWASSAKGVLAG